MSHEWMFLAGILTFALVLWVARKQSLLRTLAQIYSDTESLKGALSSSMLPALRQKLTRKIAE
jgi:hypothetical protein